MGFHKDQYLVLYFCYFHKRFEHKSVKNSKVHHYADDTNLLLTEGSLNLNKAGFFEGSFSWRGTGWVQFDAPLYFKKN